VRQKEYLRRLDAHLERSNALMAQVTEEIQLSREQIRLSHEELRLSRGERQDLRTFIREMVIRMERAAAKQAAELQDLREDSRAQRDALLRLIDRLGPSGSSA
jgi:hypothetical protein